MPTRKSKKEKDSKSPYFFSFDNLKEVWYFAMLQGATLWAYSQDKDRKLPDDFEKGLMGIREHIKDADTLKYLLSSTPVVMGLYDEILDNELLANSSKLTPKKKASKKTQVVKKSSKTTE